MNFLRILTERCVQTAIVAIFIGWYVLSVRPPDYLAMHKAFEDRFYYLKAHPPEKINLLLVGDSRVMQGLSPAVFRKHLSDCPSVFNYGFPSLRYTDEILFDIEKMLSDPDGEKTIILQISKETFPLNPPQIVANRMIHEYKTFSICTGFLLRNYFDMVRSFLPLNLRQIWLKWTNQRAFINYQKNTLHRMNTTRFHDDGWRQALNPSVRPAVFADLIHRTVSQSAIDSLMQYVQTWRARGIQVYGFYPPSSERLQIYVEEMVRDANEKIKQRFIRAGGEMLAVRNQDYTTYDDVHLSSEQAERLTLEIICQIIEKRKHLRG